MTDKLLRLIRTRLRQNKELSNEFHEIYKHELSMLPEVDKDGKLDDSDISVKHVMFHTEEGELKLLLKMNDALYNKEVKHMADTKYNEKTANEVINTWFKIRNSLVEMGDDIKGVNTSQIAGYLTIAHYLLAQGD